MREGKGIGAHVIATMGADLDRVRQHVIHLLSGSGGPRRGAGGPRLPHDPVVSAGPGVQAAPVALEPSALVTWDDVEEVLRRSAALRNATVERWETRGVEHRACSYEPGPLRATVVAVAAASVTREAFERDTSGEAYDPILDPGDDAVFHDATRSVRVLVGGTAFSVTVTGSPDDRSTATALARKAVHRLSGWTGRRDQVRS